MKTSGLVLSAALICATISFSGCSKEKVRRNALEGKVYKVVGLSHFQGVSHAGWKNTNEDGDPSVGGVQASAVSGTWDFTDLENIVIDMTYTIDLGVGPGEYPYSLTGSLDMLGNSALSVSIDSDWDYGHFPVHENKGKNLTLVFNESSVSYEEFVTFVMLEKQ